jgi:DNA-binding YbaB/EbfC family protein
MDFNAAQDMMMKNIQKLQNKMYGLTVTGAAGGGMVEVDMDGRLKMTAIRIEADALDDVEMLQDLIIAAYNSATEKIREEITREVGPFASSILNVMS